MNSSSSGEELEWDDESDRNSDCESNLSDIFPTTFANEEDDTNLDTEETATPTAIHSTSNGHRK